MFSAVITRNIFKGVFESRISTFRSYSTKDLKRFYKNVTISKSEALSDVYTFSELVGGKGFEINLDKHKLRTPGGKLFVVPNEGLAAAVATEWNAQDKVIKRHTMHLTLLSNTAIDNPMQKTKEILINGMLEHLDTDTICYRLSEPADLAEHQNKEWDPLLRWFCSRYNVEVEATTGLGVPKIPEETKDLFRKHLNSYNMWALTGYQQGVEVVKSFILATALIERALSVERTVELARLEQEYQHQWTYAHSINKWGNVEWHHDLDKYEMRSRLAAAAMFVYLNLNESRTVFDKQTAV